MSHKNFVIRKLYAAESGDIQATVIAYDKPQAVRYLAERFPDYEFKVDFIRVCDNLMVRRGITVYNN